MRLLFGRALRNGPAKQLAALRRAAEAIAHEQEHARGREDSEPHRHDD